MAEGFQSPAPLVVHTRVTPWGFVVALAIASGFLATGWNALHSSLLPRQFGIFVEPPSWALGVLLIGFALFLLLVGVAELARFVRPSAELVIHQDGISTFGLLGERRAQWSEMLGAKLSGEGLAIKVRSKGRMPQPDLNIHFGRLDVEPRLVLERIRKDRPDLVPAL